MIFVTVIICFISFNSGKPSNTLYNYPKYVFFFFWHKHEMIFFFFFNDRFCFMRKWFTKTINFAALIEPKEQCTKKGNQNWKIQINSGFLGLNILSLYWLLSYIYNFKLFHVTNNLDFCTSLLFHLNIVVKKKNSNIDA